MYRDNVLNSNPSRFQRRQLPGAVQRKGRKESKASGRFEICKENALIGRLRSLDTPHILRLRLAPVRNNHLAKGFNPPLRYNSFHFSEQTQLIVFISMKQNPSLCIFDKKPLSLSKGISRIRHPTSAACCRQCWLVEPKPQPSRSKLYWNHCGRYCSRNHISSIHRPDEFRC